jgi:sugar phosphate isomerase/epimerase
MTIGLSSVVFGRSRPEPRDWESAAASGFVEIELVAGANGVSVADAETTKAIQTQAAAAGIHFSALSVPLPEIEAAIHAAPEFGARLVVIRLGGCRLFASDPKPTDGHTLQRALEPMLPLADAGRITLALEFPPAWPCDDVAEFLEELDTPAAGACLDLGHAHLREGAAEAIEQLAGYVQTIHLHDNQGRVDDHRLPFGGSIEWPFVVMALEKTGYRGPLVFEIPGDPAPSITRAVGARTRLQAILDDLAQPMVFPE